MRSSPVGRPPHPATPLLTPQISTVDKSRWKTFVENDELKSYSFYLPHKDGYSEESFSAEKLDEWFRELHPSTYEDEPDGHAWTDASYKGRKLLRKTAWCVFDENCTCEYGYSDTWQPIVQSKRMTRILEGITDAVTKVVGLKDGELSCVNLNYYPKGGGVGFHADDEFLFGGLQRETRIISLSLCSPYPGSGSGAACANNWGARTFQVKRKGSKHANDLKEILLRHGDLITMEGMFQKYYLHSVWPGDSKGHLDHPLCQGERINLTWRTIVRHFDGSDECRGMTCPLMMTAKA